MFRLLCSVTFKVLYAMLQSKLCPQSVNSSSQIVPMLQSSSFSLSVGAAVGAAVAVSSVTVGGVVGAAVGASSVTVGAVVGVAVGAPLTVDGDEVGEDVGTCAWI